jgi:hypothetical protein
MFSTKLWVPKGGYPGEALLLFLRIAIPESEISPGKH